MAEELGELIEHSFIRTQETLDYQRNYEETSWVAIREECISGGAMDDRCNIVAASLGNGKLNVVLKKLKCGCILVPADSEEIIL